MHHTPIKQMRHMPPRIPPHNQSRTRTSKVQALHVQQLAQRWTQRLCSFGTDDIPCACTTPLSNTYATCRLPYTPTTKPQHVRPRSRLCMFNSLPNAGPSAFAPSAPISFPVHAPRPYQTHTPHAASHTPSQPNHNTHMKGLAYASSSACPTLDPAPSLLRHRFDFLCMHHTPIKHIRHMPPRIHPHNQFTTRTFKVQALHVQQLAQRWTQRLRSFVTD